MAIVELSIVLMLVTGILGYDDKYSEIDVDAVIADDDLFMTYINCILDKGPCTAKYSAEFKEILPEIIQEACAKCNDVQKEKVKKLVNAIYKTKPDIAAEIQTKYDPNHQYEAKFSEFLLSK